MELLALQYPVCVQQVMVIRVDISRVRCNCRDAGSSELGVFRQAMNCITAPRFGSYPRMREAESLTSPPHGSSWTNLLGSKQAFWLKSPGFLQRQVPQRLSCKYSQGHIHTTRCNDTTNLSFLGLPSSPFRRVGAVSILLCSAGIRSSNVLENWWGPSQTGDEVFMGSLEDLDTFSLLTEIPAS